MADEDDAGTGGPGVASTAPSSRTGGGLAAPREYTGDVAVGAVSLPRPHPPPEEDGLEVESLRCGTLGTLKPRYSEDGCTACWVAPDGAIKLEHVG
jgi:hypothetical protein